jgi:hypothetical protein
MLAALPWGGPAWYGGRIDGDPGGTTREAVRKLQKAKGLPESGTLDDKSRQALVAEYMAADGTTAPAAMELETLGVADWHRLEATTKASAKNRRVEVFLFEKQGFQPPASGCTGHGKSGDKGSCKAYDAWVKQAGAMPAAPAPKPPAPAPAAAPAPAHAAAHAPAQKTGDLLIRLHLDPAAAAARDDRFTLSSSDGKVKQVKTVKDDAKKGDQCIDLLFTKLPTEQKFTLEVDLGKEGGPHQVFKDVPYAELAGLSAKAKPGPAGDGVAALAAKIHDPPDAAAKKGREATLWNVPPK